MDAAGRARKRGTRPNGLILADQGERAYDSPLDKAAGFEVVWPQVTELFNEARRLEGTSFVYFIGEYEDDGPVKIGVAKDPIKRLRQMQTGNPRRLRVEYVLLGFRDTEKLLHELWEPFAISSARTRRRVDAAPGTEWFRPEVRERLFPIIETAVVGQVKHLQRREGNINADSTERIIRGAHIEHGFVATGREPIRLLARGAGYINLARRSRI